MGHEDEFPLGPLTARFVIRKRTAAATGGNGRDAPIPAIRATVTEPLEPNPRRPLSSVDNNDGWLCPSGSSAPASQPARHGVGEPAYPRAGSILAAGGSRLILARQMGGGVDNGGVRKCLREIAEKTLRHGVVFLGE